MNGLVVTLKSNLKYEEDGSFSLDEDGDIQLQDDDDVGLLVKTHTIPMSQIDKDGNILTGFISRCEVYWDKRRHPAPDMVDPSDLVWVSLAEAEDETEDEEFEDGENEEDEYELDDGSSQ